MSFSVLELLKNKLHSQETKTILKKKAEEQGIDFKNPEVADAFDKQYERAANELIDKITTPDELPTISNDLVKEYINKIFEPTFHENRNKDFNWYVIHNFIIKNIMIDEKYDWHNKMDYATNYILENINYIKSDIYNMLLNEQEKYVEYEKNRKIEIEEIRKKHKKEIEEANNIISEEHIEQRNKRLAKLEISEQEFFNSIHYRDNEDCFTRKELENLNLDSMENSFAFSEKHQEKISKIDIKQLKPGNKEVFLSENEIKFMKYIDKKESSLNGLPGYFTYEYNINYKTTLIKLFAGGYIVFSDLDFILFKETIKTLQSFLKSQNLPSKGKKNDLIMQIKQNCTEKDILSTFTNKYYILTEKGHKLYSKTFYSTCNSEEKNC